MSKERMEVKERKREREMGTRICSCKQKTVAILWKYLENIKHKFPEESENAKQEIFLLFYI